MGPIRNPNWSTSGMRVTLSYLAQYIQCKKKKNPGHLYLTFFTGLPITLNPKNYFFRSRMHVSFISCMYKTYLLSTRCLKKKLDSLLTDINKSHAPFPLSIIKLLVSNKENK